MKTCSRCRAVKPFSDFHRRAASPSGYHESCKSCCYASRKQREAQNPSLVTAKRARNQAWYAENRDRQLAVFKAKYAADCEARKAAARLLYEQDRERHLVRIQAYRNANRARMRETGKRHYEQHKALYREYSARYRATRGRATPPWADLDAIRAVYEERERRSEAEGVLYHVDHIVPLRGKNVCGLHVHDNLRIVLATTNLSKNNRFHEEDALAASPQPLT